MVNNILRFFKVGHEIYKDFKKNSCEPELWHHRSSHCLQCQHPTKVPVHVPAALLPLQLPVKTQQKQSRLAQAVDPWHPCMRCIWRSWLLMSPQPTLAMVVTWSVIQQMEDISYSLTLCLCLSFSLTDEETQKQETLWQETKEGKD